MHDRREFAEAATALQTAGSSGADLCRPFVTALGVAGAAVTTLGGPLGTMTICASDPVAARIDEIQTDLGEGPCWEARDTGRPVSEPDLQRGTAQSWPIARSALRGTGIGAVHAFPLTVGRLRLGSIDLYTDHPRALTPLQITDATTLAAIAAGVVLRRAFIDLITGSSGIPDGEYSRREVHQASGMVAAQLQVSVDDALLLLHGHAYSHDRTVRETARDVVDRQLDFTDPAQGYAT